jgi:hypothetical protein
LLKVEPALSNQSAHPFLALVEKARQLYTKVEQETAAEKSRLANKRAAVAAKKAQREELQLEEGVKLGGVDVGQYSAILAGLEPVRLHVFTRTVEALRKEQSTIVAKLSAAGWDVKVAYPEPTRVYRDREYYESCKRHTEQLRRVSFFCDNVWDSFTRKPVALRPDVEQHIEAAAQKAALAYVQGYAVKLAGKVGEVVANTPELAGTKAVSASVSSDNLWTNSVARIVLDSGRVLTFHTQMILNFSCLGKAFNQWPTRLDGHEAAAS